MYRGYSVQKTLRGCATNMSSKISLLVYEQPLIKSKIWYMNESIFKNFPKFDPILAQSLGKSGDFTQNLAKKLSKLVYEWVNFSWKNWRLYGSTFKFCRGTSLPKPNLVPPCPVCTQWPVKLYALSDPNVLHFDHVTFFEPESDKKVGHETSLHQVWIWIIDSEYIM